MKNSQAVCKKISISADHPTLAGHFPGNPVVPGVVILDQVRQCIEQWKPFSLATSRIKSVKFLSPVMLQEKPTSTGLPHELDIVLEEKHSSSSTITAIEFRCLQGGDLIASGQWQVQVDQT